MFQFVVLTVLKVQVKRLKSSKSPNHPFLLFGPPGTGKTKTVCETIKQLWKSRQDDDDKALIIVAAPSNTAIDIIAKELIKHIPNDVKSGVYRNAWAGIQQYNNHKTKSMLGKDKYDNKGKLVCPIPHCK